MSEVKALLLSKEQAEVKSKADPRDDFEIIQSVLRGDRNEFGYLVLRYRDQVFCSIMRQVQDFEVAEELSHETFIKAYFALANFRFEAAFSTWLISIALRHTSSYFSSRKFKEKRRIAQLHQDAILEKRVSSTQSAFERELMLNFKAALADLKSVYRETLLLCAVEGRTYEEAAKILGCPVGTIRSRLSKGRLLLKQALQANFNGRPK